MPLGWWAAGRYQGDYRRLLLNLRRHPQEEPIAALIRGMERPMVPPLASPRMVPVPSWKRRSNPLPALICQQAARQWRWARADLLRRSRPVLGQHHLNEFMRQENQKGSFTCLRRPSPMEARNQPVFLVDDILTTGATALNAAETLQRAGWQVQGLICLARTSFRRQGGLRDLGSRSVGSDTPG
ncbi:MAG: ComF family protein [Cyanobacteriota bacterium]|nr:ComF family protein [Cyanobacteriota bacterium]